MRAVLTRRHICALLLLLPLLCGREAQAARYGILLYGAVQQEVDLSYQVNGEQQAINSLRQEAIEEYSFRMKYGLGNTSLWRGSFMAALRTDQSTSSNSRSGSSGLSSRVGFLYDIDGILFGKSVAPAAFSVKSDITQVATPFSSTYQVTNTLYDFRWSIRNKVLPVAVEYITGTSVTSGQQVDSTRDRNEVYLHATQTGTIGTSTLDLSKVNSTFTTTQGDSNVDNRYEAKFLNTLNWNTDLKARSFSTGFDYSETAGINNAKYLTLSETAQWALGKSLVSGGDYTHSGVSGDPGTQTHENGTLWLQHNLFKNLMTRLSVRLRNDAYPTGSDRELGGGISLSYVKELPGNSTLNLGGSKDYSVENRNLGTDRQHIFNEQHTVAIVGPPISLAGANAVISTIVIRNADPLKHLLPYVAGSDYTVVVSGALTQIFPQGAIVDGDSLLITYDILVDPNLKTVTNSYSVNSSLALFSGAYRAYGSYQQTQQERTGQVTLAGLTAQSMLRLGFERKWTLITANTEYINFVSESDKHQSIQAQAVYSNSRREGSLTFTLSDQYQWYQPVTVGSTVVTRTPENFFSAATSYSTMLSTTTNVALNANYLNIAGAGDSDSLSLGGSLHWGLGKLNFLVNSSFGVRRQENVIGYNELLFLRVTRLF
jgi:hypothetical protein